MAKLIRVHQDNPQNRLIQQVVDVIEKGGVAVLPTDTTYALACKLKNKKALAKIKAIRRLDDKHQFSIVCQGLTDLGKYAFVSNPSFRILKNLTPGPYTFLLPASREIPRMMLHPKKKSIGLRIPDNRIVASILDFLGEPILVTTLIMPGDEYPLIDMDDIELLLGNCVDVIVDGGFCGLELTTVIDLREENPVLLRTGLGEYKGF